MSTISELEAQLLSGECVVFIRCLYLNCKTICLAAGHVALLVDACGRYQSCMVYRISEIRQLLSENPSPQALQAYHARRKGENSLPFGSDGWGRVPAERLHLPGGRRDLVRADPRESSAARLAGEPAEGAGGLRKVTRTRPGLARPPLYQSVTPANTLRSLLLS
jgi:hypothetical protein